MTTAPLRRRCVAAAEGRQELLPVRKRVRVTEVTETAAVVEREGRFLLLRGQRPTVLTDMWEFPTLDSRLREPAKAEPEIDSTADLHAYVSSLGATPSTFRRLGEIRHGITNRRIVCTVFRACSTRNGVSSVGKEAGWFTQVEASQLPLAASATRILALLEA